MKILVIDVGGTHVKLLVTGRTVPIKIPSGPTMTPSAMVRLVREAARGWRYDVVSIGYPGVVRHGKIMRDPHNLGRGWVGFNFRRAFSCPVQIVNDAAMQALGDYTGGRMLFLGLGTGLGSAMIIEGIVEPMELAHLEFKHGKTYEDYLGAAGLKRLGSKKWREEVAAAIDHLSAALEPEYVVIGGGNAAKLKSLPPNVRLGDNTRAFAGGFELWNKRRTPHG
jgi:predicted NBD/HSP70 family sugar kinase